MSDAPELLADFTRLLDMASSGEDRFTASHRQGVFKHLYGGQILAQTFHAAELTTDGRPPNSLRATFLRAGSIDQPIDFAVEREFDGRNVCTRRAIAEQAGKPLMTMSVTCHVGGEGFDHQTAMPDVAMPEDLPDEREVLAALPDLINPQTRHSSSTRPIEVRLSPAVRDLHGPVLDQPLTMWLRAVAPMSDDLRRHRALLVYASDYPLMLTSMLRHRTSYFAANAIATSLDHAMWFHGDFRADEWLLFVTDTPWAGHRRSLARGSFYTRDGRLVASVAQEGLLWPVTPPA